MVLILSERTDGSTIDVIKWLKYYSVPYIRIDREDTFILNKFELLNDSKLTLELKNIDSGNIIDFSSITVYWYRRGEFNFIPFNNFNLQNSNLDRQIKYFLNREQLKIEELLYSLLGEFKNKIGDFRLKDLNKLEVLYYAVKLGLKIPYTLVTTFKGCIPKKSKLITKCISDPFRFKSEIGSFTSYTETLKENDVSKTFFPTFIQAKIMKEADIRTFYLLGKFYSMAIMSQSNKQTSTDFRKYSSKKPSRLFPFKLPTEVENKLSKLMRRLKLETGSIDMILEPDGSFTFLEINPIGQFSMTSIPCNYYLEKRIAIKLLELVNKSK